MLEDNAGEAVVTAREIVSARARAGTLVNIARYQARGGDVAGTAQPIAVALEAAGAIADSSERALAFAEIAGIELDVMASRGAD